MKRLIISLLAVQVLLPQAFAQQANYNLARRALAPSVFTTEIKPVFLEGSDKFWFSQKTPESTLYYFVDPQKKERRLLFDNQSFADGIRELTGIAVNPAQIEIPWFDFSDGGRSFSVNLAQYKLTYDFYDGKFTDCRTVEMERAPQSPARKLSPDGRYEIYARNHDLYVLDLRTGNERRLTEGGEIFYSYAEVEHDTNENTNIPPAAAWLGDSKRVYVMRKDNRRIEDMAMLNSLTPRPRAVKYKYGMPGDREVTQYEAAVIDVESGERVDIKIDRWKDQTVDIIYATPDSKYLYMLRKKRTADRMDFCKADTRTGEVRTLIHEHVEPYLNDQLMQFSILNGGRDIIWFSERTGWGHLYHYNDEGKLLNAITAGEWVAGKILRVDTLRREIYFEGYGYDRKINPYYTQVFRANIDKQGVRALTPDDACHDVTVTPKGYYLVDNYSRVDTEPVTVLRDRNGKVITELARADLGKWRDGGWRMPERFTVKAGDGITDLHGVMWKPADFDPAKKYPIITHVYPGPQSENIPLKFTQSGGYDGTLAQLGFIVVTFGNRGGSPVRGVEYHTYGYGNLRDYAIEDNKGGLEQLARAHPYIDLSRVGIFGNSGGGMMTFAAMCAYPDFYKVGVAASGNHDNRIFNRWWGETHHGVREEVQTVTGADGVVREDTVFVFNVPTNLDIARNLQGHLLLATGDMDDNVNPAQTYRLADALVKFGKNFDFVVIPGAGHDFVPPGFYFYQYKLWFHFARYLLGDASGDRIVNMNQVGVQ